MEVVVSCPVCNCRCDFDVSSLGKRVECNECGSAFYVGRSGGDTAVQVPIVCPKCRAEYALDAKHIGREGKCVNCGTTFTLQPVRGQNPSSSRTQALGLAPAFVPPKASSELAARRQPRSSTRRRMFVFERAYIDYADRYRRLGRWFRSISGGIWNWFWRGGGSRAMEVVLRLCVVASGITLGVLYAIYEKNHGRGFSINTFFAFCLIAAYVSVLMWGWKAPVHFAARGTSGAVASGVILVVAAFVLAAAFAVFSVYLAVLLILTALSFILFLPMRFAHSLWLLRRRIAYRCPYGDCASRGLPIHICSCGQQYHDLRPSFYGIFHHKCRHPDGDVKLATMDLWGRKKLPRLCGGCKRPLVFSSIGELPERPIAVTGGKGVGKTVFIRQAVRQVLHHLGSLPHCKIAIESSDHERRKLDEDLKLLDSGQVPAATVDTLMEALGLAVRVRRRMRFLCYLYDRPGEDFETMERFGRIQVVQYLFGMILLVDPFSLPELARHSARGTRRFKSSETPLQQVVEVLINKVNTVLLKRPADRCDVPLAVVLGKADALPTDDFPFLVALHPSNLPALGEKMHSTCREALEKLGEGRCVRALEQKFSTVRYFACSALGRVPDPRDTSPFQPVGVIDPFLWMMGLNRDRAKSASV